MAYGVSVRIRNDMSDFVPSTSESPAAGLDPRTVAQFADALQRGRHIFFPHGYFADASWQMLLELYVARLDGRRTIVTDLCLEPRVPCSTVLRHLERAIQDGYVRRSGDPLDKRKSYVALTDHGEIVMMEALSHVVALLEKMQASARKPSVFL